MHIGNMCDNTQREYPLWQGGSVEQVIVLDRVCERHPDITKEDAATAWEHCLASAPDLDAELDRHVGIGLDGKGRLLELVAVRKDVGLWLIIHAQTPPHQDVKRKLGIERGRRHE